MKKKILAIGAYERDNFGDLLFYQVLKDAMRDATIIAGSVMYSDMTETLGEKVLPYPVLLDKYVWDAVWVVGGEVGGVDIERAYNMSLSPERLRQYRTLSDERKEVIQRAYGGSHIPKTAYLPDIGQFELNKETPLIINSVGVSNIGLLEDPATKRKSISILRRAHQLVVRDEKSKIFCEKKGIQVRLMPDMIHSISRISKWNKLKDSRLSSSPYITFQINQSLLQTYDRNEVADTLVKIIKERKMKIIMIAAGTAVHHDSYAEYQRLKMLVGNRVGHKNIEVLLSRSPMSIVEAIVNSRLWIGTSLHGRIVASSFHVPRISLTNHKVATYALAWDPTFPYDVPLYRLTDVTEKVLSSEYTTEQIVHDEGVAKAAEDNLHRLKAIFA